MNRQLIKNKIIYTLLISTFIFALFAIPVYAQEDIRIFINGEELKTTASPQIIENRVFVPFRAIFEALGAQVEWDNQNRQAIGQKENIKIILQIDNKEAKVNNDIINLDVAAKIIDGRTMVPVRFIAESLGEKVNWDKFNRIVKIGVIDNELINLKEDKNDLTKATKDLIYVFDYPPSWCDEANGRCAIDGDPESLKKELYYPYLWYGSFKTVNNITIQGKSFIKGYRHTHNSSSMGPMSDFPIFFNNNQVYSKLRFFVTADNLGSNTGEISVYSISSAEEWVPLKDVKISKGELKEVEVDIKKHDRIVIHLGYHFICDITILDLIAEK